jgi:hypothetical protein
MVAALRLPKYRFLTKFRCGFFVTDYRGGKFLRLNFSRIFFNSSSKKYIKRRKKTFKYVAKKESSGVKSDVKKIKRVPLLIQVKRAFTIKRKGRLRGLKAVFKTAVRKVVKDFLRFRKRFFNNRGLFISEYIFTRVVCYKCRSNSWIWFSHFLWSWNIFEYQESQQLKGTGFKVFNVFSLVNQFNLCYFFEFIVSSFGVRTKLCALFFTVTTSLEKVCTFRNLKLKKTSQPASFWKWRSVVLTYGNVSPFWSKCRRAIFSPRLGFLDNWDNFFNQGNLIERFNIFIMSRFFRVYRFELNYYSWRKFVLLCFFF